MASTKVQRIMTQPINLIFRFLQSVRIQIYLFEQKDMRIEGRIIMLTLSSKRFVKIQREAPTKFQQYLVQATKYHAVKTCKPWPVAKWPMPPVIEFRRDCTYGKPAAMRLPMDVQGPRLVWANYRGKRGKESGSFAQIPFPMLEKLQDT